VGGRVLGGTRKEPWGEKEEGKNKHKRKKEKQKKKKPKKMEAPTSHRQAESKPTKSHVNKLQTSSKTQKKWEICGATISNAFISSHSYWEWLSHLQALRYISHISVDFGCG
jgi:hypothetical protein